MQINIDGLSPSRTERMARHVSHVMHEHAYPHASQPQQQKNIGCEVDHGFKQQCVMAHFSSLKQLRYLCVLLFLIVVSPLSGQCGSAVVFGVSQLAVNVVVPGGVRFLYATGSIDPTSTCSTSDVAYVELDPLLAPAWAQEVTFLLVFESLAPGETRSTLLSLSDLVISIEAYRGMSGAIEPTTDGVSDNNRL